MRRNWARGVKQLGKKRGKRGVECSHMVYVYICIYICGRISTDGVISNILMQNHTNL